MTRLRLLAAATAVLLGGAAHAVTVTNSVPSDASSGGSLQLGDIWTFYCPPGGTYSVLMQTASVDYGNGVTNDNTSKSALDPAVLIYDGAGNNIGGGDDDVACTITSITGFTCARIVDDACGTGRHYLLAYSAAGNGGGAYQLTVTAKDSMGVDVLDSKIRLGGGPKPRLPLPQILDPNKSAQRAQPLSNDLPLFY